MDPESEDALANGNRDVIDRASAKYSLSGTEDIIERVAKFLTAIGAPGGISFTIIKSSPEYLHIIIILTCIALYFTAMALLYFLFKRFIDSTIKLAALIITISFFLGLLLGRVASPSSADNAEVVAAPVDFLVEGPTLDQNGSYEIEESSFSDQILSKDMKTLYNYEKNGGTPLYEFSGSFDDLGAPAKGMPQLESHCSFQSRATSWSIIRNDLRKAFTKIGLLQNNVTTVKQLVSFANEYDETAMVQLSDSEVDALRIAVSYIRDSSEPWIVFTWVPVNFPREAPPSEVRLRAMEVIDAVHSEKRTSGLDPTYHIIFRNNGSKDVTVIGTAIEYLGGAIFDSPEGDGGDPEHFELPKPIISLGLDEFDLKALAERGDRLERVFYKHPYNISSGKNMRRDIKILAPFDQFSFWRAGVIFPDKSIVWSSPSCFFKQGGEPTPPESNAESLLPTGFG